MRKRRRRKINDSRYIIALILGLAGWTFFYRDLRNSTGLFSEITELTGLGRFRPLESTLPDSFFTLLYQLILIIVLGIILYLISKKTSASILSYGLYHGQLLIKSLPKMKGDGLVYILFSFLPSLIVIVGLTIVITAVKKRRPLFGLVGLLIIGIVFLSVLRFLPFIY
jgi:hypothetical protein